MNILYCGLKHDYGDPEKGYSFEHINFFQTLQKMQNVKKLDYIPIDEIIRINGKDFLNELIINKAIKEKYDLIFFFLFKDEFYPETLKYLKDTLSMSFELINNLKPLKENMLNMSNKGYTTATDFADYLVKEKKLTFREAYGISSKLVNYAEIKNKTLDEISLIELKKFYKNLDKNVLKIFKVKNSMNAKTSYGGTATINIKRMIKKYKKEV